MKKSRQVLRADLRKMQKANPDKVFYSGKQLIDKGVSKDHKGNPINHNIIYQFNKEQ